MDGMEGFMGSSRQSVCLQWSLHRKQTCKKKSNYIYIKEKHRNECFQCFFIL